MPITDATIKNRLLNNEDYSSKYVSNVVDATLYLRIAPESAEGVELQVKE